MRPAISRAIRASFESVAKRAVASERLMSVVYDVINEQQFSGLGHHEEMLSDHVRVDAYHRGIHNIVKTGDVVLDVGTGTGLLAFIASRAGAKKVYAVDHSEVIELAEEIGRHNGFTNIEYVRCNSRDFTPNEPIDVVVHEQMSDELFGENMVENLLDARRRFLAPGGTIAPGTFRLFVEPVVLNDGLRVDRIWNSTLPDDLDYSCLRDSPVAARYLGGRADQAYLRSGAVKATLGAPSPIIEFDLMTIEALSDLSKHHEIERVATVDAQVDGFCVWFEAEFDANTMLSTSPVEPPTSWGHRILRVEPRAYAVGETIGYQVTMGQLVDGSTWELDLG